MKKKKFRGISGYAFITQEIKMFTPLKIDFHHIYLIKMSHKSGQE